MAGIDRLYLHNFGDFEDLRKWAIVYYPKLLLYFYSTYFFVDYIKWEEDLARVAKGCKDRAKKAWKDASTDGTLECAIAELVRRGFSQEDAAEEARALYKDYSKTLLNWYNETKFPVMQTPFKIDKKLVWICPINCVRKYLEDNCGIKTRWYHKIFWRGKDFFDY